MVDTPIKNLNVFLLQILFDKYGIIIYSNNITTRKKNNQKTITNTVNSNL